MMLTRDQMLRHGNDWVSAWNRRDLEAVLVSFAENAIFRSPMAEKFGGSDLLGGKSAMKAYWKAALAKLHHLHFRPIAMICDEAAQAMVVHYEAELDNSILRACEIFHFGTGGKLSGEALYGGSRTTSEKISRGN